MRIQSLSIVVPNNKCVNNCKFCVSQMVEEQYEDMLHKDNLYWNLYRKDYIKRLEFARDNGCNTVMITGNSEPQQNKEFLRMLGTMVSEGMSNPFKIIEMQTTGVMLNDAYLYFLRHHVGVSTISLSISSFDNKLNKIFNGTPDKLMVDIPYLCSRIKKYRFNLRLSLNLTKAFNHYSPETILKRSKQIGANQVTFRILYSNGHTVKDKWIKQNRASDKLVKDISSYVSNNGRALEVLEYGHTKYSIFDMGVVIDDDCMSTIPKRVYKYVILRPDCKLYSKWDDKGSLIF